MKYCVILTSDTGKQVKVAGNVYIDIDIMAGNTRITELTVRDGDVFPDRDIRAPRK